MVAYRRLLTVTFRLHYKDKQIVRLNFLSQVEKLRIFWFIRCILAYLRGFNLRKPANETRYRQPGKYFFSDSILLPVFTYTKQVFLRNLCNEKSGYLYCVNCLLKQILLQNKLTNSYETKHQ
jgi:hypothetical protein